MVFLSFLGFFVGFSSVFLGWLAIEVLQGFAVLGVFTRSVGF